MTGQEILAHGAMEGGGSYNKHAKLQARAIALAIPIWEKAVRSAALDSGHEPVVIADYGSSQGKNSLTPMQVAIRGLRHRLGPDRPISVVHIDQAANDFNTLFQVLDADPDRYAGDDPNVYPSAIGRSFYESVLPPCSVHLGWSSYAAMWLSCIPALIPGHFIPLRSSGAVRERFNRQAAEDWQRFLSLRARELRPGGRLVIVLPVLADDGLVGLENIVDHTNTVLADMVSDGWITAEERARMIVSVHPQRKCDLFVPFAGNGSFQNLEVEGFETYELPDAAWIAYQKDGDRDALAAKHALFIRSAFAPSLASALDEVRSGETDAFRVFADRLEAGLRRRVTNQPAPMHSLVQTIALAKSHRMTLGRGADRNHY